MFIYSFCFGQSNSDILILKGNDRIYLDENKLSKTEIESKLSLDNQIFSLYKKGKIKRDIGYIFALAGSFTFGYGIGMLISENTTLNDNDSSTSVVLISIGGAVLAGSIPLYFSGKKNIKKSIEDYNNNLNEEKMSKVKIEKINFISNKNGLGLALVF